MVSVGVLGRFEVKPGLEQDVADFFKEGLPLVEAQPSTTVWFAFRLSETTYGACPGQGDSYDGAGQPAERAMQQQRDVARLQRRCRRQAHRD